MRRSHGPIVQSMTRHNQHLLGIAVFPDNWDTTYQLDTHAVIELEYLYNNLVRFNGYFIQSDKSPTKVFE